MGCCTIHWPSVQHLHFESLIASGISCAVYDGVLCVLDVTRPVNSDLVHLKSSRSEGRRLFVRGYD